MLPDLLHNDSSGFLPLCIYIQYVSCIYLSTGPLSNDKILSILNLPHSPRYSDCIGRCCRMCAVPVGHCDKTEGNRMDVQTDCCGSWPETDVLVT